jgi:hypothetical protein
VLFALAKNMSILLISGSSAVLISNELVGLVGFLLHKICSLPSVRFGHFDLQMALFGDVLRGPKLN